MSGELIAIVGSYDPVRRDLLGLKSTLEAYQQAGEDLGRELAEQQYRIVVYSSLPCSLELDVVRGYLSSGRCEPGSIQVLFSQALGQPAFREEKGNEDKFSFRPDYNPDWEFSFYQSLSEIDGMLLVGGAATVLVAGVMERRKPIVAYAGFGGSSEKIWKALHTQRYVLEDQALSLMSQARWSRDLAGSLVGLFRTQKEAIERVRVEAEQRRPSISPSNALGS
jgi:hypothetical protein